MIVSVVGVVVVVAIQSVKHLLHVFQFAARTAPRARPVRRNRSPQGRRSGRMMGGHSRPRRTRVLPRRRFAAPLSSSSSSSSSTRRRRGRLRGARGVGYLRRPGRPDADAPGRRRRRRATGNLDGAPGVRSEPGSVVVVVVVAAEDGSSSCAVQMLGRQQGRRMHSSSDDETIAQRPGATARTESGQVGRVQPGVERHLAAEHPRRVKVKGRRRGRRCRQVIRLLRQVDFRRRRRRRKRLFADRKRGDSVRRRRRRRVQVHLPQVSVRRQSMLRRGGGVQSRLVQVGQHRRSDGRWLQDRYVRRRRRTARRRVRLRVAGR